MAAVLSRRGLFGAGAVALGVGAIAGGPVVSSPASATISNASASRSSAWSAGASARMPMDPDNPLRSLFTGQEGTEYTGSSAWSAHRLVLLDVADLPGDGDAEHRFRLVFATDDSARDGIYRIVRDGDHLASLFLARVSVASHLEAIVDRSGGAA